MPSYKIVAVDSYDDYLEHHGIIGQRWGVRRYQRADGSLTKAGRRRQMLDAREEAKMERKELKAKSKIEAKRAAAEIKAQARVDKAVAKAEKKAGVKQQKEEVKETDKIKKKSAKEMTDEELQAAIARQKLEKEYAALTAVPVKETTSSAIMKTAKKALRSGAEKGGAALVDYALQSFGKAAIDNWTNQYKKKLKDAADKANKGKKTEDKTDDGGKKPETTGDGGKKPEAGKGTEQQQSGDGKGKKGHTKVHPTRILGKGSTDSSTSEPESSEASQEPKRTKVHPTPISKATTAESAPSSEGETKQPHGFKIRRVKAKAKAKSASNLGEYMSSKEGREAAKDEVSSEVSSLLSEIRQDIRQAKSTYDSGQNFMKSKIWEQFNSSQYSVQAKAKVRDTVASEIGQLALPDLHKVTPTPIKRTIVTPTKKASRTKVHPTLIPTAEPVYDLARPRTKVKVRRRSPYLTNSRYGQLSLPGGTLYKHSDEGGDYIMHSYHVVTQDDYIAHHGVIGQKWGVRRYQNKDGSLTKAGKLQYASYRESREKKGKAVKYTGEEYAKLLGGTETGSHVGSRAVGLTGGVLGALTGSPGAAFLGGAIGGASGAYLGGAAGYGVAKLKIKAARANASKTAKAKATVEKYKNEKVDVAKSKKEIAKAQKNAEIESLQTYFKLRDEKGVTPVEWSTYSEMLSKSRSSNRSGPTDEERIKQLIKDKKISPKARHTFDQNGNLFMVTFDD